MKNCKYLFCDKCINTDPKKIDFKQEVGKNIKEIKVSNIFSKNISNISSFEHYTDEELFNNLDYINFISEKLEFCLDNDCNNPRCKNFVIIYTNIKCGSTALWSSINLFLSNLYKTFHFHNEKQLEFFEIYYISINQLIKLFKKYKKNVIIIDIYRPIFDIMVSSFMNNLSYHFCKDFNIYEFTNKDNIIERFFNIFDFNYKYYNVDYFLEIYNLKTKYNTFNFENKFLFYEDDTIKYIKLRLCDSHLWGKIFKKIFGWNIKIVKHNETKKKNIGKIYNYFKDKFTISTIDMEVLKNNKFFNFYFSEEEQKLYLKNFSDKIDDNKIYPKFSTHELSLYYYMLNENDFLSLVIKQISDSNSTLVLNCLCNTCKLKRFNLLKSYLKDYLKK
jgi:hypothetical protein